MLSNRSNKLLLIFLLLIILILAIVFNKNIRTAASNIVSDKTAAIRLFAEELSRDPKEVIIVFGLNPNWHTDIVRHKQDAKAEALQQQAWKLGRFDEFKEKYKDFNVVGFDFTFHPELGLEKYFYGDFNDINNIRALDPLKDKIAMIIFDWSTIKFIEWNKGDKGEKVMPFLLNLLKPGGKFIMYNNIQDCCNFISPELFFKNSIETKDKFIVAVHDTKINPTERYPLDYFSKSDSTTSDSASEWVEVTKKVPVGHKESLQIIDVSSRPTPAIISEDLDLVNVVSNQKMPSKAELQNSLEKEEKLIASLKREIKERENYTLKVAKDQGFEARIKKIEKELRVKKIALFDAQAELERLKKLEVLEATEILSQSR